MQLKILIIVNKVTNNQGSKKHGNQLKTKDIKPKYNNDWHKIKEPQGLKYTG